MDNDISLQIQYYYRKTNNTPHGTLIIVIIIITIMFLPTGLSVVLQIIINANSHKLFFLQLFILPQ